MIWLDRITDTMDMSLRAQGVGDRPGGLACYIPWGRKELDTTERLNCTEGLFSGKKKKKKEKENPNQPTPEYVVSK